MPISNAMPALTEAAERVLGEIIRITEDNELDRTKSSAWLFSYPYITDNQGNSWHKDINIRNDKSNRALLNYYTTIGLIKIINVIEHPYIASNVKLSAEYKFVYAFELMPKDVDKLKQLISTSTAHSDHFIKLDYDVAKGFLIVNGNSTQIRGTNQKLLLEMLFNDRKNLSKEWDAIDVSDFIDPNNPDAYRKGWHRDTANAISNKLAKTSELGIEKFLIATRQSVKINSRYLV